MNSYLGNHLKVCIFFSNAIRYGKNDNAITISGKLTDNQQFTIITTDDGKGIAARFQYLLFKPIEC